MTLKKGSLAPCSTCHRLTLVLDPEQHVCERCQHPFVSAGPLVLRVGQTLRDWGRTQHLDPDDERVVLIDRFTCYLRDTDRGENIVRRWPWVWDGVAKIESELGSLTFEQVRSKINSLLKRLSCARGRRGRQNSGPDAPYWQDANFGRGATRDGDRASGRTSENENKNSTNSTQKKDENMALYVEAPAAYELVDRGEHTARVSAISEPEQSKFDPEKQSIKFTFELIGGPFEGQKLSKYYTLSLSKMASLGRLYRVLLGKIEPGERVDIEQLIGQDCAIQVTHKVGDDDESYAVVQDVFKPVKEGKRSQKEPVLAGDSVPF